MASIKRRGDRIRVQLRPEERMVLGGFAREVADMLGGVPAAGPDPLAAMVGIDDTDLAQPKDTAQPDDPAVLRLLPDAYDDPAGAAEFRRLTDSELRRGKSTGLARLADDVDAATGPIELDLDQADMWTQAVNDIRLVLGVRLEVNQDGRWRAALPPEDPRHPLVSAYDWLTMLQEMLIDAMLDD